MRLYISVDDFEVSGPTIIPTQTTDSKTIERLSERSYVRDWHRLGLTGDTATAGRSQKHDQFRLTFVNAKYLICQR